MWNIIEYNQIARGERIRLLTAGGLIEGVYRGSECISEEDPTQWIVLSDATLSPVQNPPVTDPIRMTDTNVQLSQIIALDLTAE